jgi:peptide/nickel transport system substrate-binding protein
MTSLIGAGDFAAARPAHLHAKPAPWSNRSANTIPPGGNPMLRRPPLMLLAALGAPAAYAQSSIMIGVGESVTSMDPHYLNSPSNKNVLCNIYDALTDADNSYNMAPSLAESWRLIDDNTWEFKLRAGVKFHDGQPLTAEDVRASYTRVPKVPNAPAPFTTYIRLVKSMTVVDPLTIRFHTSAVDPILSSEAAQIRIIPARWENATNDDFNSGRAAIGTGPLKFVAYNPGQGIDLARNEHAWGPSVAWDKVTFRFIADGAARVAALLAGDVQVIDLVPIDSLPTLRANNKVRVATAEVGLRYIFLALDQSRDEAPPGVTGPNGEALEKNPFRDLRVRKALSLAINRPLMVERVMEHLATATGQMMPAGGFGSVADLMPPPFDPEQARKLLAEAGYPNGFRVVIHSPRGRFVNDARIVQAVAQMWQRVGVQAAIELQPWSTYASRVHRGQYPIMLGAVAAVTGESSQVLRSAMGTYDPPKGWGGFNWGKYSNPAFDELLTQAQSTADDAQRAKLLQDAMRLGAADVANIPLHLQRTTWATQANLRYVGRSDDQTRVAGIEVVK